DQHVGNAVTIDVTGRADGVAAKIVPPCSRNPEALGRREGEQIDVTDSADLAVDHEGFAGILPVDGIAPGADNDVIDAIAVDIAAAVDRSRENAAEGCPRRGRRRAEIDIAKAARLAIDQETLIACSDQDIADSVVVDVAGG